MMKRSPVLTMILKLPLALDVLNDSVIIIPYIRWSDCYVGESEGSWRMFWIFIQADYGKNCLPEKIFIMNIKSLFWTKISKQTSIHKESNSRPGLMSFEDRIAIWLEGIIEDHKFNSTCLCSGIMWIPRPWSMATLSIQVLRKLSHLW